MVQRLVRTAVSFTVVYATYWLYALAVVPLIEPQAEARPVRPPTPEEIDRARGIGTRNAPLLERIFPPGAWQRENPKVIEVQQAMLLIKDYKRMADGRLELNPCSIIFFAGGAAGDPRARPVVLDAPLGAKLKFDQDFDPTRGKVGKLLAGQLDGEITIRSAPTSPDANDELLIKTRDVLLDQRRIWTPQNVVFSFGPNRGSGRHMQILLDSPEPSPDGRTSATSFGTIQAFELRQDVQLQLYLGGRGLMPSGQTAGAEPAQSPSPVRVTCQGPFRFDAARSVATFSQRVDVERSMPSGPSDQMLCEVLAIQFERRAREAAGGEPGSASARAGALEPRLIEAFGNPVIVRSPSSGGHATAQHLEYDLLTQRISLEGEREAQLHQQDERQSIDVGARRLDYQPSKTSQLGRVYAIGPGWIQGIQRSAAQQRFQARWSKTLSLRPDGRSHALSILGDAQVSSTAMGGLAADEIHLWMLEEAAQSPERQPPIQAVSMVRRKPRTELHPDRLLAVGRVSFDSPQLTGATRRLEAWFTHPAAAASTGGNAGLADGPVTPAQQQRTPAAPPKAEQYDIRGGLIRIQLAPAGKKTELTEALVEGDARLIQTKAAKTADGPLAARGARLHLVQAKANEAKVTVAGKPAYIEARGMSLSGAKIQLDQAANRVWIDGAGRMNLPMDRGLDGRALGSTKPMEITWQRAMNFNGRTAVFLGSIAGRSETELLRTEYLEVMLNGQVDFARSTSKQASNQKLGIEKLVCRDGVYLEQRPVGPQGLKSIDRLELKDLLVNWTSGAISGSGPGTVTTTRYGTALAMPGAAAPPRPAQGAEAATKLTYLNVQFERGLTGNVHRRELTFADQVKAVYGPVAAWEDKLNADPDTLGEQGGLLTCQELTVRESPVAGTQPRGPMEMEARGNAVVEGKIYMARADSMRYDQEKGQLILEGIGRNYAQLHRQLQKGGQRSEFSARKIWYWPATNQYRLEGGRGFDSGVQPVQTKK